MAFNPNQPRDAHGRWTAVGAYISEDGFKMNELCRQGYTDSDPRIGQLDEAIAEGATDYDGDLYRGMDNQFSDWVEGEMGGARLEYNTDYSEALSGLTFKDEAFVSSTMDKDIAIDFASRGNGFGTFLEIKNKPKSLNVSDVLGEDQNWQAERIFPRGTSFSVKSARTDSINGHDVLVLEVDAF